MQGPLPMGPQSFTLLMSNGAAEAANCFGFHTRVNLTKQGGGFKSKCNMKHGSQVGWESETQGAMA